MYLYGQAPGGPGAGGMYSTLIMFALIFAIFYFIIILPAKKKQKAHQNLLNDLKGGEKIMTSGGIFGRISRVLDDRFILDLGNNVKIEIAKTSVQGVIPPEGGIPEEGKK